MPADREYEHDDDTSNLTSYNYFCLTVKRKPSEDALDKDDRKEKRAKISTDSNAITSNIKDAEKTKNTEMDAGNKKDAIEENEVVTQVQGDI